MRPSYLQCKGMESSLGEEVKKESRSREDLQCLHAGADTCS